MEGQRRFSQEYALVVLGGSIAGVGGAVEASRTFGRERVLLLEAGGEIGGEYLSTYRPVSVLDQYSPADPLARMLLEELTERRAVRDGILQPVTLLPVLSHLLGETAPLTLYNTRLTGISPAVLSSGREGWQLELYLDGILCSLRCASLFDTTSCSDSCPEKREQPSALWFDALVQLPGSGRDDSWFPKSLPAPVEIHPYAVADYWIMRLKLKEDHPALGRDEMFRFWRSRPASMKRAVLVGVASQVERSFSGVAVAANRGDARRLLLPEGYAANPVAALDKGIDLIKGLLSGKD